VAEVLPTIHLILVMRAVEHGHRVPVALLSQLWLTTMLTMPITLTNNSSSQLKIDQFMVKIDPTMGIDLNLKIVPPISNKLVSGLYSFLCEYLPF